MKKQSALQKIFEYAGSYIKEVLAAAPDAETSSRLEAVKSFLLPEAGI